MEAFEILKIAANALNSKKAVVEVMEMYVNPHCISATEFLLVQVQFS